MRNSKNWTKPKHFDRNLIVIGAGSAGLVSSYIAAASQAKVTLIEQHKMGGDCLNTGCVPSKALIRIAHSATEIERAKHFGIHTENKQVDFERVMEQVQEAIASIAPHDSIERYTKLGVECIQGRAQLISPWEVEVNHKRLTAKNIILATGAKPFVPTQIQGLEHVEYYTSDTIWQLKKQPKNLLIVGAGPIGCELGQAFSILGSHVTLVDTGARPLAREEPDASAVVAKQLEKNGVNLHFNTKILAIEPSNAGFLAVAEATNNETIKLPFDAILFAVGRQPNTQGLGLEALHIERNNNGSIKVNKYLQTSCPNIYAVGDLVGPYQLTHAAAHQAWFASMNALFGSSIKRFAINYHVLPAVTYTTPEVARVGITEKEAQQQNLSYEVTSFDMRELDRAIVDNENIGFIKVLTHRRSDKILGVTIVSTHAAEQLTEFTLAMKNGLGLNKILATIHPYPTWSEANKYVAGVWKKRHISKKLLAIAKKLHAWRLK